MSISTPDKFPGAGTNGQPLKSLYGRTAATTLYEPVGTNHYDALQARLERRFLKGVRFAANYTWSKAIGIAPNNDSTLNEPAPAYWGLNRSILPFSRLHNLSLSGTVGPALRQGQILGHERSRRRDSGRLAAEFHSRLS